VLRSWCFSHLQRFDSALHRPALFHAGDVLGLFLAFRGFPCPRAGPGSHQVLSSVPFAPPSVVLTEVSVNVRGPRLRGCAHAGSPFHRGPAFPRPSGGRSSPGVAAVRGLPPSVLGLLLPGDLPFLGFESSSAADCSASVTDSALQGFERTEEWTPLSPAASASLGFSCRASRFPKVPADSPLPRRCP
jgi:hypothetical protein